MWFDSHSALDCCCSKRSPAITWSRLCAAHLRSSRRPSSPHSARARAAVEGLAIPHEASSLPVKCVTASAGLATAMARHGGTAQMPHALIAAADRALYRAKANGRNRVETALVLAGTDG